MGNLLIALCGFVVLVSVGGPAWAADAQAPAERTIVLVPHGGYVPDPKIDEKIGPHLSPLGSAQAHLAGARLAGMPAGSFRRDVRQPDAACARYRSDHQRTFPRPPF